MERIGRERAFFDHVEARSIGDIFRLRAEKALCDLPAHDNPYLTWILLKRELPPAYLDEVHYATIASRLDRIELVEAGLDDHLRDAPPETYDAWDLSDCFEYMSQEQTDDLLRAIQTASRPGARIAYWNLLVARDGRNVDGITAHPELSETLHAIDRAFLYGRFVVESV